MPEFRVVVNRMVETVYYVEAENAEEAAELYEDEEFFATHWGPRIGEIEIEEQDDE